ncbi:ASCH domain-containing protein [Aquabacterium humicola]|uniref:ASCH domain-containing protein n=1 Tax=Aquabacterium humicola TaxID=3237377 RepID=UPI002543C17B|nr:ASCH domain-containing protein [Rubrivivax pictus]
MESLPSATDVLRRLSAIGIHLPADRVRIGGYGDCPELSEELITLIREGRKRAGTSLLWAMEAEGELLPDIGDIEVVVDHQNSPAVVTRVVRVEVLPYEKVTADYAAIEGEGDGSLQYWRDGHWAFFARECARIGRLPSREMPVVCCVFEVLHVIPHSDP